MNNKLYYFFGGAVISSLLWKNSISRCWIKFFVFFLVSSCTCLAIPLWIFRPRDSRNVLLSACMYRAACKIWGLTYTIEGQENIVQDGGSVVLINHQSIIDLVGLSHLWPLMPNCTAIAKKELLYLQPFGLAFWLCGVIFIDRSKSKNAQESVNKSGEIIRKRKASVLIFPEGTRNMSGKLLPFKKGPFHLALASRCPIQPIVISRYNFLGPNKFDSGKVKIRILEPISTKNLTKDDLPELIDRVYNLMSRNVDELSADTCSEKNIKLKYKL